MVPSVVMSGGKRCGCSADGQKAGGAEALKRTAGKAQLSLEEARQILGVESGAAWDAIEKVPSH